MIRTKPPTWNKLAAFVAVALILPVAAPFIGSVLADNSPGSPDGLVVVVQPRYSSISDGAVVVQAVNNLYIFDFALHTPTGAPFLTTSYDVDINTVDPNRDPNEHFEGASLIYSQTYAPTEAVSNGVIRIPASALGFQTSPFDAVAFTINVYTDGNGASLLDENGMAPAGQFSLLANALAKEGRWAEADQADELLTPLVLVNGQFAGLVQVGNPVLNPGFEIGGSGQKAPLAQAGFATALPPWFLIAAGDAADQVPASHHFLSGAAGVSGSAASIHINTADNGRNLIFGQFFSAFPGSEPGIWVGTDSLVLDFDTRISNSNAFLACATIHWLGDNGEEQLTKCRNNAVPSGYAWTHVTHDFGNVAEGKTLTSVFLSLNHMWTGTPIVLFDNVRISGAEFRPGVDTRNDLTDGFSTFMFPTATSLGTSGDVSVLLTQLGDGSLAYVFEVAAMDYTGINPQEVDLAGKTTRFQLLDENYLLDGMPHGDDEVVYSTGSLYNFVDAGGATSERGLAVVPASAVEDVLSVVPWFWVDMGEQGPNYETIFGEADPASGYYSALRNSLMGHSLADQLDYAFMPVALSTAVGAVAAAPTLTLSCPDALGGSSCAADPTPDVRIVYETASRVIETIEIQLVAVETGEVLRTGTVTTPGGVLEYTITEAELDALAALGNTRVEAIAAPGVFTQGASDVLRLDNILPVADFSISNTENLVKGSRITVVDTSTDDQAIARWMWEVTLIDDPTPDGDSDVVGAVIASGSASSLTFSLPDDGIWQIELTVVDQDGEESTIAKEIIAYNQVPVGSISAPAAVQPNGPVTFVSQARDLDGFLLLETMEWRVTAEGDEPLPEEGWDVSNIATFVDEGAYLIEMRVMDNDLEYGYFAREILVDGTAPETAITHDVVPSSGWFTTPVDVLFARSDAGAGVVSTTISIGTATETVTGAGDFTRTIGTDGEHLVTAFSTDAAGNIGELVTKTVKVDVTPPTASFERQTPLTPFDVIVGGSEATIFVNAQDAGSGVAKVVFFVEGEAMPIEDTDGTDGWSVTFSTVGRTGFIEISAIAYDNVGHHTPDGDVASLTVLVLSPGLFG